MERKFALVLLCSAVVVTSLSACSSAKDVTEPSASPAPAPPPTARAESAESADPAGSEAPPADVVTQIIQKALRTDGSVSYDEIVRQLGTPREVEAEPITNSYQPDQVDTLRTLSYRGVEALVYDVSRNAKTFLIRFSLLNDRYATPEGLRVGDPQARMTDLLGPPTRRNPANSEYVYAEDESMPTAMIVTVRDGRVARVDWEFYFS